MTSATPMLERVAYAREMLTQMIDAWVASAIVGQNGCWLEVVV